MVDPDFPDGGAIPTGLEIAFGADINGDQNAWSWSDESTAIMSQEVGVTRGRQDESSDVAPTAANLELDNPTGNYTPGNAMGVNYPDVDLGTPARWWVDAPTTRLYLRPVAISSAEIPSSAALDLSGDLDVRIDMHLKTMDPSGNPIAIMGRAEDGGTFSWRVYVHADRTVTLLWSATGAGVPLTAVSTTPVVPMSTRSTLRITLDVDNGAAGRTITFYIGESVTGPFTQVGPAVVQAGTTAVANVAEPLVVGTAVDLSVLYSPDADVYAFLLLDGIGGSALVDADFTTYDGTPPFVDATGNTWDLFGAAMLTERWYRIVGTIDEWAPRWPWGDLSTQQDGGVDPGEARTEIAVAGILRRLGQGATPLDSPVRLATDSDSTLRAYWPMEDLVESTQIATAVPGGLAMTVGGIVDFAGDDTLAGSKAVVVLDDSSYLAGPVTGAFSGSWSVTWYLHIQAAPASSTRVMIVMGTGTVAQWNVDFTATQVIVTGLDSMGATITTATGANTNLVGTDWRQLRLMARQSGGSVIWEFVWLPVTFPATAGSSVGNTFTGAVGGVSSASVPPGPNLAGLGMGHLAVLASYVGSVTDNAGTGWTGDTAVERMDRLCDQASILFRVIGEPSTTQLMGPQQVATLLTLLGDAADADGGILYEMPDAVGLIYRTLESLYNQPANMTLDALVNEMQNPFAPILDDQRIRNDITVTRSGGSSSRVTDEASIDEHGRYDESTTLELYADSQTLDIAAWKLHQGTVEGMRIPQLTTNLGVAPEVIGAWLTVDTGARVDVTNLSPQWGVEDARVIMEGYGETVAPFDWIPTMNCSPGSVWDVGVLDGDGAPEEYLLRLETDGSELAFAVTDSDTTMFVEVTAGPAWTDDNAETPFALNIGGEQVTVTDIDPPAGGDAYVGAGNPSEAASVSHVAPSVVASGGTDLLLCVWCSHSLTGTYTVPGSMTALAATGGVSSSARAASEVLAGAGATGTRTATFSVANPFSAISLVVHSALGTPSLDQQEEGVSPTTQILSPGSTVPAGSWLLAIRSWDEDPGNNMSPPDGDGWELVADSALASTLTSRTAAWVRKVGAADAGIQVVVYPNSAGVADNHARLFVLSNVTGVTQEFTVTRSTNGVIKAHDAGTDVSLWFDPVLAR